MLSNIHMKKVTSLVVEIRFPPVHERASEIMTID
jgi:hypothetical protein